MRTRHENAQYLRWLVVEILHGSPNGYSVAISLGNVQVTEGTNVDGHGYVEDSEGVGLFLEQSSLDTVTDWFAEGKSKGRHGSCHLDGFVEIFNPEINQTLFGVSNFCA